MNVNDERTYCNSNGIKPDVAKCIPTISDKVGKGNNHFHFEATQGQLAALWVYAHDEYDRKKGNNIPFRQCNASRSLEELAERTLFVGRIFESKVPKLYEQDWRYQLNEKQVSREKVEKLIPNKDMVDAIFGCQMIPKVSVKSHIETNRSDISGLFFLECGIKSEYGQSMIEIDRNDLQSIPYLKDLSKQYDLIFYEKAAYEDLLNLDHYIEYHKNMSLDEKEKNKIIIEKNRLLRNTGCKSLVTLTIMASFLYGEFPKPLCSIWWEAAEYWSWKNSDTENAFIKEHFSQHQELGKCVYDTFFKKVDMPNEPEQPEQDKAILLLVQQPEIQPKIQSSSTSFFKSCMEYKKSIIALVLCGGLFAGHLLGIFNIFNHLSNLKS